MANSKYSISVLFKLVDQLTKPLVGMQTKMKAFDKSFKKQFGKNLAKTGAMFEDLGKKMTVGLTLPLTGAGVLMAKKAIDFEDAFAGVRKTVNATEPEFAAMRKGFIALSKSIPLSTEELMHIGEMAGQLGIKNENILGFTKVMADLAATTNLSSEEAATSLARFANIMQMPQQDVDRLGATIVDLGNNFATTEAEIVQFGMRIAGAGRTVGLNESQVMSLAAALSSLGIEAEMGGTAVSQTFLRMSKEMALGGQKAQIFAKVAGMSVDDFKKMFKQDAVGALQAFIKGMKGLNDEGKDIILVLDALGLDGARMADVLLRMSGAGDLINDALKLGANAWEKNTALTAEAQKRYDTMASRLKVLRNQLMILAADFGEAIMPALKSFVDMLIKGINWVQSWPTWLKKLAIVFGIVVAALGPILLALGTLLGAFAAVAVIGAPLALLMAKIAAGVALVTAAVAALLVFWDDIKEFFNDWVEGVRIIADWAGLPGISPDWKNANESWLIDKKNSTKVDINVKALPGTQAKVDDVQSKGSDVRVNNDAGYTGAIAPAGGF